MLKHGVYQVLEVFRHSRVGVMVREGAVGLAEKLDNLATELSGKRGGHRPGRAVAGVEHHLERPCQSGHLDIPGDILQVAGYYILCLDHSGRGLRVGLADDMLPYYMLHPLDIFAVDGLFADAHLETVVLRRVVASGYHDAAAHGQGVHRIVLERGRALAEVYAVYAASG